MVRTKIEIDISALGQRNKIMNIIIGSNTTSRDVIRKVLEKVRLRDPLSKFQLLSVAKNDSNHQGNYTCNYTYDDDDAYGVYCVM